MTTVQAEQLPEYALKYAPYVYLHEKDVFMPGHPLEHLKHVTPKSLKGDVIDVAQDIKNTFKLLAQEACNKADTFLTLNQDIRDKFEIEPLMASHCKPDNNGRSHSPAFFLRVDKPKQVGPGVVDIFYFFFYPFNEGNKVLFKHFGNHVGDWEHAMIRFKDGVPQAMHLSAHADGNAWKWELFEKKGDRPVIYSAGGSHAMYPTAGTHNYSGVFLVGPQDHTSKGPLWDPTLNYCTAHFHPSTSGGKFTNLVTGGPGHNTDISDEQVLAILEFKGRWGNSFSELRKQKSKLAPVKALGHKLLAKLTDRDSDADALEAAEEAAVKGEGAEVEEKAKKDGVESLSLHQKLLLLIYAEGPTGPRDKSLNRKNMNRWDSREMLEKF